jgi:hypothetical protein
VIPIFIDFTRIFWWRKKSVLRAAGGTIDDPSEEQA